MLGEVDGSVEVCAGMLDDPPPVEIESVLLEIEFFLHLDAPHAEECRKLGRHGVGEVNRSAERPRRGSISQVWRNPSRGQGASSFEEAAAREGSAYGFLTSGNAHAKSPSVRDASYH